MTTITMQPPDCVRFGLTFACGTCHRVSYVMCERGKDGIELSKPAPDSMIFALLPCNLVQVRTESGKLLISCGYCQSGKTVLTVSPGDVGTSCLRGNCTRKVYTEEPGERRKSSLDILRERRESPNRMSDLERAVDRVVNEGR